MNTEYSELCYIIFIFRFPPIYYNVFMVYRYIVLSLLYHPISSMVRSISSLFEPMLFVRKRIWNTPHQINKQGTVNSTQAIDVITQFMMYRVICESPEDPYQVTVIQLCCN